MQSQRIPRADGAPPTFAAPAASETIQMGSILIVKNASAGAVTVTLATPGSLPTGADYPDKAYSVAAGAEVWIPTIEAYRDHAAGGAVATFSATTSVTAAAIITD